MMTDTRLWMYRKGEACLFGHPDKVPSGEGWTRFPLPDEPPPSAAPRVTLPEPGPDRELTDEEKLDRLSRQRLMQVASACGARFETSWTKAQLKHAILEALNGDGT
jgi:hypothetical protein